MIESWKKNKDGDTILHPLTSFQLLISTAGPPRLSLQLKFLQEGDAANEPTGITQVVLNPDRARQIARALDNAALQVQGGLDVSKLNNLS